MSDPEASQSAILPDEATNDDEEIKKESTETIEQTAASNNNETEFTGEVSADVPETPATINVNENAAVSESVDPQPQPIEGAETTAENPQPAEDAETAEDPQPAEGAETAEDPQPAEDTETAEDPQPAEGVDTTTEDPQPAEDTETAEDPQPAEDAETAEDPQPAEDAETAEDPQPAEDAEMAEDVQPAEGEAIEDAQPPENEETTAEDAQPPEGEETTAGNETPLKDTADVVAAPIKGELDEMTATQLSTTMSAEKTTPDEAVIMAEMDADESRSPLDVPYLESGGKSSDGKIPPAPPAPMGLMTAPSTAEAEGLISTLSPVWSYGLNRHVPVLNLSTPERKWIFYASAHLGVLYDMECNRQFILQGHSNTITCTAASADKRWLVTGDRGEDSMVVIWDSTTGMPVRTMFEPHPCGVVAIQLTPDARYLATLSAEPVQTFAIWDWTTGDEMPLCSASLSPAYGVQNVIRFSPEDISHVVTNSDGQVLFYCWKGGKLDYFAPPLTDTDFNKPVGKYSSSIFLQDGSRAVTATSQGLLVVWDCNTPLVKVNQEPTPNKKAVKLVPMHERGITTITFVNNLIATGDSAGHVKFFDQNLQLIYWYQNFNFGPVNSISFSTTELTSADVASVPHYPSDATIPSPPFVIRDFIIGTTTAVVASCVIAGTKVDVVIRDHDAAVHALATHPHLTRVAVGGYSGLLKIWNYETRIAEVSRYFDRGNQIKCCEFDPKGMYLAVGFTSGLVRILDAMTLTDVTSEPFAYARDEITHLAFSPDSNLLASADGEYTTTLFRFNSASKLDHWIYVGRHRAHYKPICDVLFGVNLDNNTPRLLTLGEDRFLVEYDLVNASKDNLPILQKDRIEQSATPRCMMWYPEITKEQFLCMSNDQFKLKLFNTTTKMCRKTLLGPTFGSPVKKMCTLPVKEGDENQFLVYIINDKVGLNILPLDGNPHNAMCVIAHPAGVTNLACSFDGKFLFTSGGTDTTVTTWAVNTRVLEAQSSLGGTGLVPFYALLEGGRDGQLFAELEDYFYYAQLRSQGINTMETRKVNTHMPISEVPFVMRAMGFYPTEQEIEDMMNEIKFSRYVETGEYVTEVDLGDFIRLFVNHRPVFGLDTNRIEWAFQKLGIVTDDKQPAVDRTDLLDILQTHGEHMSEYELAEYVTTLLGYNPEGGSCELEEFDPTTAGDIIEANLPVSLNAEIFTRDILSLGIPEAQSKTPKASRSSKRSLKIQTE